MIGHADALIRRHAPEGTQPYHMLLLCWSAAKTISSPYHVSYGLLLLRGTRVARSQRSDIRREKRQSNPSRSSDKSHAIRQPHHCQHRVLLHIDGQRWLNSMPATIIMGPALINTLSTIRVMVCSSISNQRYKTER